MAKQVSGGRALALLLIVMSCWAPLMFFAGFDFGEWCVQCQAVEAGHAEFYIDADFQRHWRWLPAQQGSE